MYVGVDIEKGIELLSKFLAQNLQRAKLKDNQASVRFIPDSFEELLQTRKSVSGLWALGDVCAALSDYQRISSKTEIIIKKINSLNETEDETVEITSLQNDITDFYGEVYSKRSESLEGVSYWGIPDRLPLTLTLKSDNNKSDNKIIEIKIEDPRKSSAHLYATVNYMSLAELAGKNEKIALAQLLLSFQHGWYVNGLENNGLEDKYGWPLFPSDSEKDAKDKPRLVDPIASLTVIENLAIIHKKTRPIKDLGERKEGDKDKYYEFIRKAWETSLGELREKNILSIEGENHHRSETSTKDDNRSISEEVTDVFFRGYNDICRSLLAITGILEQDSDSFMEEIIGETKDSLTNKVVQIINTLIEQLKKDIIRVDKIHDRGRVFRRSNGVVVQYVGVGSAFILYSILQALSVIKNIQKSFSSNQKLFRSVVRTLIIQVLQQIMTEEHIELEPTNSLSNIRENIRKDEILKTYDVIGGYVFDECLPGKADAYEFIFFWQSAYALRALLLCQDLAKQQEFSWLTHL